MSHTELRPALRNLITKNNLIGAEIGVFQGHNAFFSLWYLNMDKLYLIDPYAPAGVFEDKDPNVICHFAGRNLSPFNDKIVWLRMTSDKAISHINETLDYVYIDGDHSYEWVMKDINNFYNKMKPGSIMGGHDFDGESNGVERAVREFFGEKNIEVFSEFDLLHLNSHDWWVWIK